MQTPAPFISVIICTRDRHEGFRRALASVLAQPATDFEVIVVDSSTPPVCIAVDAGRDVRRLPAGDCGEGMARAMGLQAARGELVAWCDDDDEWTPDHLQALRDALLQRPEVDLVYAAALEPGPLPEPPVVKQPSSGRRLIRYGEQRRGLAISSSSVLHRAAAARAIGGFDRRLRALAGGDLWSRMLAERRGYHLPRDLTLHHREQDVASHDDRQAAWELLRRDWGDITHRTNETRRRMRQRQGNVVPFNAETWNASRRELLFQAQFKDTGSFGIVTRALTQALQDEGVGVTLGPLREGTYSPEHAALTGRVEPQDRISLVYDWRSGAAGPRAEIVVLYTMWETTIAPPYHIEEINNAATMIYVPCRENVRVARESGIEVPAKVLVHGVDARRFPYLERPRDGSEPYTFGTNGVFNRRKGIDALIRAFQEEFLPGEPVRLVLKNTWRAYRGDIPDDPRIVPLHGFRRGDDLLDFLRELDAYVLPSRGEGFGLTGIEAMATGLPLIATNWSGPAEYLDPADSYPLRYTLEDTGGEWFGDRRQWGYWAEPDIAHLRQLMRHLFEHREEGIEKGRQASARVHRDWTWQRVAQQVIADFDQLARGVTPV